VYVTLSFLAIGLSTGQAVLASDGSPSRIVDTLSVEAGARALGFAPAVSGPVVSVGAGHTLGEGRWGARHLTASLGGYRQPGFASGGLVDVAWKQRWTARWGGGAELGAAVGAQSHRVPGVVYAPGEDGTLEATRAPVHAGATLGLRAGLGWGPQGTQRPTRVWLRYAQDVVVPFMPHNDVPVMGTTHLTAGITTAMGKAGVR